MAKSKIVDQAEIVAQLTEENRKLGAQVKALAQRCARLERALISIVSTAAVAGVIAGSEGG